MTMSKDFSDDIKKLKHLTKEWRQRAIREEFSRNVMEDQLLMGRSAGVSSTYRLVADELEKVIRRLAR